MNLTRIADPAGCRIVREQLRKQVVVLGRLCCAIAAALLRSAGAALGRTCNRHDPAVVLGLRTALRDGRRRRRRFCERRWSQLISKPAQVVERSDCVESIHSSDTAKPNTTRSVSKQGRFSSARGAALEGSKGATNTLRCGLTVCAPSSHTQRRPHASIEPRIKAPRNRPFSEAAPTAWHGRTLGYWVPQRGNTANNCTIYGPPSRPAGSLGDIGRAE